jgi:hypothetical protein
MPYRKLMAEAKIEALTRVLRGERVTAVADAMGVSRNSLAVWMWRAYGSMRSNLGRKKSGSSRRAASAAAQLDKLRERIARREKTIEAMRDQLRAALEGPVPGRCVKCGCERFNRNGFCMMSMEQLLGVRLNSANGKIPVQKFTCMGCGNGARLEGAAALYHWVNAGLKPEGGKRGRGGEKILRDRRTNPKKEK